MEMCLKTQSEDMYRKLEGMAGGHLWSVCVSVSDFCCFSHMAAYNPPWASNSSCLQTDRQTEREGRKGRWGRERDVLNMGGSFKHQEKSQAVEDFSMPSS